MNLLWWRKPRDERRDETDVLTDLSPKREHDLANRIRRVRNGQDVETEQILANLRNFPGP